MSDPVMQVLCRIEGKLDSEIAMAKEHREDDKRRFSDVYGRLDKQDYYRELLRLAYRLIFLFVTEDRDVLLEPDRKPDCYKLKDLEETSFLKEVKVPMKKYDDGDDLTGFGLVEPKDAPQPKIRKNDPKTRGRRPEHEWTPMDVAAEFSYQVGRKYPLLPGTVSVKQLSGALSKFRKQYGTTALIELELLRLFMADEDNFRQIGDEAPFLYKKFLSSFGKKMNQARENLGLNKVTAKIETEPKAKTLVASDGRVFQNSMSGRAQLERYEKKIRGEN